MGDDAAMESEAIARRRPPGLVLLVGLIVVGMGIPAFFRWKVYALGRERDRILEEAPSEPAARLELLFRQIRPHILQALQRARFSASRPWIVSHVVVPAGADGPPEVWGIHATDDVGHDVARVDGLEVRVQLPAPRLLGREVLVGDNAMGVQVFAAPGPADPRELLRDRVEFVMKPLIESIPDDIPGTRVSIEVGGLVRPWEPTPAVGEPAPDDSEGNSSGS